MEQPRIDFRFLTTLAYGFVIISIFALGNLLVGDEVKEWFEPTKTVAVRPSKIKSSVAEEEVVNGIHLASGLVYADGFNIVRGTCTACHSVKLVTQNRATREGWTQMIRWMQATQGLWELGENEPIILDYLAKHYAPEEEGRRANLEEIEWYVLDL